MFSKKKEFPTEQLVHAIGEIAYAMKENKSFEVRRHYIENAIHHLKESVSILNERK